MALQSPRIGVYLIDRIARSLARSAVRGQADRGPDMIDVAHYRVAERLLEEAESCEEPGSRALWCLELAKLHTALAQVAATALNSDGREWTEVAGRRLSSMTPTS